MKLTSIRAVALGCLVAAAMPGLAENVDPANDGSQYAWGENVGWVNLEPSGDGGPGMEVGDFAVGGWLWGENIGWISLSCENTGSCEAAGYRVRNDGNGYLSGQAWAENAGWIDFWPLTAGGVTVDPVTGEMGGYAWGENIGWISFRSTGPEPFVVRTGWTCEPSPPAPSDPPSIAAHKAEPAIVELTWDPVPGGTGYDVVHGDLRTLRSDPSRFFAATHGCIGENVTGTAIGFDGTPLSGDGIWFLVRAVNCGGSGTYDTLQPSQPYSRDEEIGDSPGDCRIP